MSRLDNERVKGFLRCDGVRLVNEDGEEIILNGYGTANWENTEGFMIGSAPLPRDMFQWILFPGPGKDHNPERWTSRRFVSQMVRELCGAKYESTYWDRWEANHLRAEDIKLMAELGFNCARIVLNANALLYEEPGYNWNEGGFSRLADIIDACEKYRIYAILDMHGVVGGNNGATGDSLFCEYPSVFLDEESTERQIVLWEEIVRRFGDRWCVAGYDLINEPVSSPVQHEHIPLLVKYYEECIERIRKIDKKHIFFLEGAKYARDFRIFDHQYDPECHNWAISIHLYGASPEIKDLYPWLLKRDELNVPLWLGECGSGPDGDPVFFDICDHLHVSYTPWGWKTAAERKFMNGGPGGRRGMVHHWLPEGWEKIQAFQMVGPRPSYEECIKIFDAFIESTKIENCDVNYDGPRTMKKIPNITLAGVAYDMWNEDGSRYYGTWEGSNYLNFRLEDHTKLVWACTKAYPYPKFAWYHDQAEERYNPLQDLALELHEGEYANYSVREVKEGCKVCLEGIGEGEAELICQGKVIGNVSFAAGDILAPVTSDAFEIGTGERVTVKVVVKKGTLTLKNVKFAY